MEPITRNDRKHIDELIGARLRKLRSERGLSQAQVGAVLPVSYQQMQKYETGTDRLSASTLYVLAKFFEVPIHSFFSDLQGADDT